VVRPGASPAWDHELFNSFLGGWRSTTEASDHTIRGYPDADPHLGTGTARNPADSSLAPAIARLCAIIVLPTRVAG
jgi:hypothetical protein